MYATCSFSAFGCLTMWAMLPFWRFKSHKALKPALPYASLKSPTLNPKTKRPTQSLAKACTASPKTTQQSIAELPPEDEP